MIRLAGIHEAIPIGDIGLLILDAGSCMGSIAARGPAAVQGGPPHSQDSRRGTHKTGECVMTTSPC